MRIFGSSFSILPSVFTDNFGHGNFIFLKQRIVSFFLTGTMMYLITPLRRSFFVFPKRKAEKLSFFVQTGKPLYTDKSGYFHQLGF